VQNNWCWAATSQMIMELLGEPPKQACQCRQAEQVLGVKGCCVTPSSCLPADELSGAMRSPRWPAFVEKPERYNFSYTNHLRRAAAPPERRSVRLAAAGVDGAHGRDLRGPAGDRFREVSRSANGHTIIVKGFSNRPTNGSWSWIRRGSARPAGTAEGELGRGLLALLRRVRGRLGRNGPLGRLLRNKEEADPGKLTVCVRQSQNGL